jgi:hypothetical protein
MKNIVESWKTTALGILVLIAAISYIFIVQDSKVFQFAILLIVGIGFLFAPDTIWLYLWYEDIMEWKNSGCKLNSPTTQISSI